MTFEDIALYITDGTLTELYAVVEFPENVENITGIYSRYSDAVAHCNSIIEAGDFDYPPQIRVRKV